MSDDELDKLIGKFENERLEFKADLKGTEDQESKHHVMRSVSAFFNTKGGILLLGVRDKTGEIVGLNDIQRTEHGFTQQLTSSLGGSIHHQIEVHDYRGTGKRILIIHCPKGLYPPYILKGYDKPFIRVGSTNQIANEDQIAQMYRERSIDPLDRYPIKNATIEDLDLAAAKKYIEKTSDKDVASDDIQRILINEGLLVALEGAVVPTIAGILLFGRAPQEHLPHATIKADVKLTKDQDDWDDIQTLGGTIFEQIRGAESFIKRNIPISAKIVGFRRIESPTIPLEALREVIINALVHRDYQDSSAEIQLRIRGSSVSILSPGGLVAPLTIEVVLGGQFHPRSRNGTLAEALIRLKYMEKRGTGIERVRKLLRDAKLSEPEFKDEGNSFSVVINALIKEKRTPAQSKWFISEDELERLNLNEEHYRILELVEKQSEVRTSEVTALLDKSKPVAIKRLEELVGKGILVRTAQKKTDPSSAYRLNPNFFNGSPGKDKGIQSSLGL